MSIQRADNTVGTNACADAPSDASAPVALERSVAQRLVLSLASPMVGAEGQPIVLLMSGLPGTGKSHLSRWLGALSLAIVVGSDHVRKSMYASPAYTPDENEVTHRVCRMVMRDLLGQGCSVIYDATNLVQAHRRMVYRLADEVGARLLVVRTVASEDVVRRRLDQGKVRRDAGDLSDADWDVYLMLRASVDDCYARQAIEVDTSRDPSLALARILAWIAEMRDLLE